MCISVQKMNTINFSELQNWSALSHLVNVTYESRHPFVKIGSFLKRVKEVIEIQDNVEYKRATIKINNGGIFLRDNVLGKNIGTKNQYVIHKGQLLLSKIDARNGAFGIVPEELEGGVITGNFWVFEIDTTQILPQILCGILSSQRFQSVWETCSNGTTNRHYLQETAFMNTRIPVPQLSVQKELIADYNKSLIKSNNYKTSYIEAINRALTNMFQLKSDKNSESTIMQFVQFENLSRWDVENVIAKVQLTSNTLLRRVGDFIQCWMEDCKGSLSLNTKEYTQKNFLYLGMENVEKETGKVLALPTKKGDEIKSTVIKVPYGYIVYNKLRPYLNKYWINNLNLQNVVCSSEFFVFRVEGIDVEYFMYILSSDFVQVQLQQNYSGARMPRINKNTFFNIKIPVPTFEEQKETVLKLNQMKKNINRQNSLAEEFKENAQKDFENAIFG